MDQPKVQGISDKAKKIARVIPCNRQTMLMDYARKQGSFDSAKLTEVLFGGKDNVERQNAAFRRAETALGTLDTSKLPRCYGNESREDTFLEGLRSGRVTIEDGLDFKHDYFAYSTHLWAWGNASPFGVHTALFIPMIKLQANEEQRAYWISLSESAQIIGSYCQTELGHGSFVRGIETTATFDEATDEFIIHSPSLSSAKYWPGGLGYTASHTIVIARLIIREMDYGIHAFVTQLRSLEDFSPMPGIELGDIGTKMSYNGTDNGYAIFNRVRVPRMSLLMSYATVGRDGTYESVPNRDKLLYGGMLNGRADIIRSCGFQLAQAVTIATRYSTVREQGFGPTNTGPQEWVIMLYKSQHYRLLTLIAKSYAVNFAWKTCRASHLDLIWRQDRGDHSTLPYNHMLLAGLKAWVTQVASEGAEDARKSCGGQGYMAISGLPEIVASVTATTTFEGENYVMWQQVARYIVKAMAAPPNRLPGNMAYIEKYRGGACRQPPCVARGLEFISHSTILGMYRHRAATLIIEVTCLLAASQVAPARLSVSAAWNEHMMHLISASRAHIEVLVLESFIKHVEALEVSPDPKIRAMQEVLSRLVSLFGLTGVAAPNAVDTLHFVLDSPLNSIQTTSALSTHEDGTHVPPHLTPIQILEVRSCINHLLPQLLPDAIALTDAWNFTNASLASAIGMRDGNVYETIMNWTRQLPINVEAKSVEGRGLFRQGWEESIRPVLRKGGRNRNGSGGAKL